MVSEGIRGSLIAEPTPLCPAGHEVVDPLQAENGPRAQSVPLRRLGPLRREGSRAPRASAARRRALAGVRSRTGSPTSRRRGGRSPALGRAAPGRSPERPRARPVVGARRRRADLVGAPAFEGTVKAGQRVAVRGHALPRRQRRTIGRTHVRPRVPRASKTVDVSELANLRPRPVLRVCLASAGLHRALTGDRKRGKASPPPAIRTTEVSPKEWSHSS